MKAKPSEGPKSQERQTLVSLEGESEEQVTVNARGAATAAATPMRRERAAQVDSWALRSAVNRVHTICDKANERRAPMSETEEAVSTATATASLTMEAVLARANMRAAWTQVKGNKGAAGVDGKRIADTEEHLKAHWPAIRDKLLAGAYQPSRVRLVEIPKAGQAGTRRLGIPTVQDRLIQQALSQILGAHYDRQMSQSSYGFRPGRSAHQAIDAARAYVASGKRWVVDIDLKSFFDQIEHDRLMTMIGEQVRDKRILSLIGRTLRAPMEHADGRREKRAQGSPQGGPLSPLLANIYLSPLDRELEQRGIGFVRYADDIALFVGSRRAAERALDAVRQWLAKHLKLEINEDKSGIGPSEESQLLGFRIHEHGEVSVAPKALAKLKLRVRALWDARKSQTDVERREGWRRYIDGWWNYFGYANWQREVRSLSGWMRRHIRKYYWQRWHHRAGRRNALERNGITGRELGVAGCRRGAWRMARHGVMHRALGTAKLNRWGLQLPWELAGAST